MATPPLCWPGGWFDELPAVGSQLMAFQLSAISYLHPACSISTDPGPDSKPLNKIILLDGTEFSSQINIHSWFDQNKRVWRMLYTNSTLHFGFPSTSRWCFCPAKIELFEGTLQSGYIWKYHLDCENGGSCLKMMFNHVTHIVPIDIGCLWLSGLDIKPWISAVECNAIAPTGHFGRLSFIYNIYTFFNWKKASKIMN